MGILGFIIVGFIAGAIATALRSGPTPGGVLAPLLVGIVGAVVGGLLAAALRLGGIDDFFGVGTWVTATVGAFVFLVLFDTVVDSDNADHDPADGVGPTQMPIDRQSFW